MVSALIWTCEGHELTHPYRIHHGEQDDIVPIGQSEQMDRALRRAAAVDVTFTRYPDAAHDSWTAAYENAEVFRWMLGKRRTEGGEEIGVREENKVVVSEA